MPAETNAVKGILYGVHTCFHALSVLRGATLNSMLIAGVATSGLVAPVMASTAPEHHKPDGSFVNTDGAAIDKSLKDLWRAFNEQEKPDPVTFPVRAVEPQSLKDPDQSQLLWVGHSTFLIQSDGMNILTDPQFSRRSSPLSFAGPERTSALPLSTDDLPPIDAVVISHNHYDHLDEASVKALQLKQTENPPQFFVPLGLADWFHDIGIYNVTELDWWQSVRLGDARFYAVPVKHWSARGLLDRNQSLWAGWIIDLPAQAGLPGQRLLHVGDSGYSQDFQTIGECFQDISLAMMPIGAYDPRWFMKDAHMNPEEAVQAFLDTGAASAVGMHWGTFILTFEAMTEPPVRLKAAASEAGLEEGVFTVMQHGEARPLPADRMIPAPRCDITSVSLTQSEH